MGKVRAGRAEESGDGNGEFPGEAIDDVGIGPSFAGAGLHLYVGFPTNADGEGQFFLGAIAPQRPETGAESLRLITHGKKFTHRWQISVDTVWG